MQEIQLCSLIEEAFQKKAWHGPNLRGALRGVSVDQALWRPATSMHNTWEIVVHAAYWKHRVARRLKKSRKNVFLEKGTDWFVRDKAQMSKTEAVRRWKSDLALLVETHQELRDAIETFEKSDLTLSPIASRESLVRNIVGIAMHDIYHAGQIRLLGKLYIERRSLNRTAR